MPPKKAEKGGKAAGGNKSSGGKSGGDTKGQNTIKYFLQNISINTLTLTNYVF